MVFSPRLLAEVMDSEPASFAEVVLGATAPPFAFACVTLGTLRCASGSGDPLLEIPPLVLQNFARLGGAPVPVSDVEDVLVTAVFFHDLDPRADAFGLVTSVLLVISLVISLAVLLGGAFVLFLILPFHDVPLPPCASLVSLVAFRRGSHLVVSCRSVGSSWAEGSLVRQPSPGAV